MKLYKNYKDRVEQAEVLDSENTAVELKDGKYVPVGGGSGAGAFVVTFTEMDPLPQGYDEAIVGDKTWGEVYNAVMAGQPIVYRQVHSEIQESTDPETGEIVRAKMDTVYLEYELAPITLARVEFIGTPFVGFPNVVYQPRVFECPFSMDRPIVPEELAEIGPTDDTPFAFGRITG